VPVVVGGTGLYLDAILRDYRLPEVPRDEALRREVASFSTEDLSARLKASSIRLHNTTDVLERDRLIRAIEIAEFKNKEGISCSFGESGGIRD
jgi:tRNA dimethylallyltransferase